MKYLITLVTLAALSACGQANSTGSASAPVATPAPQAVVSPQSLFEGAFNADCQNMKKLMLKNTAGVSELIVSEYFDDQCKNLKAKTRLIRSMVVQEKAEGTDYYPVDFTYTSIDLTLESDRYDTSNVTWYAYTDWKNGVSHDIMGRAENYPVPMPVKGDTFYQSWKLVDGAPVIEAMPWSIPTNEGRSPDHRSLELNRYVFTKA